jgi:hypothetical protein
MAVKKEKHTSLRQGLRGPRPKGNKLTPRKIARYGWKKDLPDQRDFSYSVPVPVAKNIPPSIDLRPNFPPVYDQQQIGSCTANAIAAAIEFDIMKACLSA